MLDRQTATHEHAWYFVLRPGGWLASCGCGLEGRLEHRPDGRAAWEWTLHGRDAPPLVYLPAVLSVLRARRELLSRYAGRN